MYDAIVIGSGIGGMTAAGLLAGVARKRVLVLEKHTEPGGQTHVFRRDGASWDVGVHYVGEVEPGSQARAYFDYLSGGELRWNRMPESFDRYIYPGLQFATPADPALYAQRLIEAFPDEAPAIRQYFRDIRKTVRWTVLGFMRGMVPHFVAPLLRLLQKLTNGLATQTTKAYLDAHFRSPQLRALLASLWGDYGLPPARSAFAIHALITHHYFQGGWFPDGGSSHIARTFERGIEARGGSIRVAQEVVDIVVENGQAVGVRVIDRRGPQPVERSYRAPIVISNVGARPTFEKLLPTTGVVGAATAALRAEINQMGTGLSTVTLYLRLRADARTLGLQGENFWVNTGLDHDDVEGNSAGVLAGQPHGVFVSFPSIKAGDTRFHTAEITSLVDPQAYQTWRSQPRGNRGADYSALKARIGDGLLALAETAIPGLTALVSYRELSTPLTMEHYTSHPAGAFYGLPSTPARYRANLLGPRTPIKGLFLSGQDAGSLGIVGAMMGGVGAACQALGAKGFPMIQAALKRGNAAPAATAALPQEKRHAVLVAKTQLTPTIWDITFQIDSTLADYAPGQFARLHVGQGEWRDYSIAGVDGEAVRFLISTRTGGDGSHFIETACLGTRTEIELPLGEYTLVESPRSKVFVATGTGLTPFLPMFGTLAQQNRLGDATLLFGYKAAGEDITAGMAPLPARVLRCVSRDAAPAGGVQGRVTDALAHLDFDPADTDFYVCGSSAMVADCKALLERRGALHVYIESY
jgi:all-trans-retinol 13,14-reductase